MTEQYKCQSYYDDDNILRDCTCGKCGSTDFREQVEVAAVKILGHMGEDVAAFGSIDCKNYLSEYSDAIVKLHEDEVGRYHAIITGAASGLYRAGYKNAAQVLRDELAAIMPKEGKE